MRNGVPENVQLIPQSPKRISLLFMLSTLYFQTLQYVPQTVCFCSIENVNAWKIQVWGSVRAFLLLFKFCLTALLWSSFLGLLPHTPQGKFLAQSCDSAFCRAMASAVTGRKLKQNRGRAAVDITEGSDISPLKWREKEESQKIFLESWMLGEITS